MKMSRFEDALPILKKSLKVAHDIYDPLIKLA